VDDVNSEDIGHLHWYFDIGKENFALLIQVEVLLEGWFLVLQDAHAKNVGVVLQHVDLNLVHVEEVLGEFVVFVLPVADYAVEAADI
jgi:hypothetical protein